MILSIIPESPEEIRDMFVRAFYHDDMKKARSSKFINNVLKDFYQEPETIVKIEAYNSSYVYLTGSINRPMSILLSEQPLKLLDSLMRAGYVKDQKTYNKKEILNIFKWKNSYWEKNLCCWPIRRKARKRSL